MPARSALARVGVKLNRAREGAFGWTAPSEDLFRSHLALVGELGGYLCGRGLYETMLVAEEIAAALDATDKDVSIGGAGLASQAVALGLVDELRIFRFPVVVGGGTPLLPPVTEPSRWS